jgi:hypothetical protein
LRKHSYKFALLGTTLSLAVLGTASLGALPQRASAEAQAGSTTTSSTTETSTSTSTRSSQGPTAQANAQEHLANAQLKSCENRQKAITNIMSRISDRGQKQLTLFATIATRTETFYTNKAKTLSNYAALVADVNAKAAAAQTAVTAISSSKSTFSCTGNDPKGVVGAFKSSQTTGGNQ